MFQILRNLLLCSAVYSLAYSPNALADEGIYLKQLSAATPQNNFDRKFLDIIGGTALALDIPESMVSLPIAPMFYAEGMETPLLFDDGTPLVSSTHLDNHTQYNVHMTPARLIGYYWLEANPEGPKEAALVFSIPAESFNDLIAEWEARSGGVLSLILTPRWPPTPNALAFLPTLFSSKPNKNNFIPFTQEAYRAIVSCASELLPLFQVDLEVALRAATDAAPSNISSHPESSKDRTYPQCIRN